MPGVDEGVQDHFTQNSQPGDFGKGRAPLVIRIWSAKPQVSACDFNLSGHCFPFSAEHKGFFVFAFFFFLSLLIFPSPCVWGKDTQWGILLGPQIYGEESPFGYVTLYWPF